MTHPYYRLYPEVSAGGFSRVDGTVDFYTRVASLMSAEMTVVDFGAGRGAFLDETETFRSRLQRLQGRAQHVIGVDIDPVVLENPGLDEAIVYSPPQELPLGADSVDLVVSDFTFEHIEQPEIVTAELRRILKPGGWICARTPNRRGYIALSARSVPQGQHHRVLRRVQPDRQVRDVFPAFYRLNTRRDLRQHFPSPEYDIVSYTINPEPAYFGQSVAAWRGMQLLSRLTPPAFGAQWLFFIHKRPAN